MFRSLDNDSDGFVNDGLDVSEGSDDFKSSGPSSFSDRSNETKIHITRSKYNQESLFREMVYRKEPSKSFIKRKVEQINKEAIQQSILDAFPIISWLRTYSKDDFTGDLVSGCTVAIMQIPQGMGYALLANLPPVVGIYMAFFPVLLYVIFGTSRHNAVGTFAVVSIMVGKSVITYSSDYSSSDLARNVGYTSTEVATLLCFLVGMIQLIMYISRMGVLSFLLSECLVSGFTTGAAIHVFTSQVKDLLGIKLQRISGTFEMIKTYTEVYNQLTNVNIAALIMSLSTIVILLINNEILKPRVSKITKIPVPIELILVVGGTFLSKYANLPEIYGIDPVGHIPLGLPEPSIPRFDLWRELLVDSIAIAFVSYSITVSMALIFGQKYKYEIGFNQEILALSVCNIFSSMFSCLPTSASLSRTVIQETAGARTQLASFVSSILILFVLLWIGPFFEVLPRCILAGVVVVAIKGMLMKISEFNHFRRKSNRDGFVWLLTFLSVVIFSIDVGLLVGICLSVLCLFFYGINSHMCVLGNVPQTDFYLDIDKFQKAIEIPNVKIVQYSGTINYATKASFRNQLCEILKINLLKEMKQKEMSIDKNGKQSIPSSSISFNHLIIDFGPLANIDSSSIKMLTDLINDFEKLNIKISISSCTTKIYEILIKNEFKFMNMLYPSIQDAVHDTLIDHFA